MTIRIEIHTTANKQVFFDAVDFRLKMIRETFNVEDELDFWDASAWHICAVDDESNQIIGYCRVMAHDWRIGFVFEQEFDITNLMIDKSKTIECGRLIALTMPGLENPIPKILSAVLHIARTFDYYHIIGTPSINPSEHDVIYCRDIWHEKYKYSITEHGIPRNPYTGEQSGIKEIPKLISAYEKLNARVISDPCWDPVFETADVLMMLNVNEVNDRWLTKICNNSENFIDDMTG